MYVQGSGMFDQCIATVPTLYLVPWQKLERMDPGLFQAASGGNTFHM